MNFLSQLSPLPPGVPETLDLITQLDTCWSVGFANLSPAQWQTLTSLVKVFNDTPLGLALQNSLAALDRHEFITEHFLTLATARASLQGALHDALQQQVKQALDRPKISELFETSHDSSTTAPHAWQESSRQWLMELALTGWGQLNAANLTVFLPTLEQLQDDPAFIRLATLLTGFWHELFAAIPMTEFESLPLYRWNDLWTRAMLATLSSPPESGGGRGGVKISGELQLLGLKIHQHLHMVTLTAYGLLQPTTRLIRLTLSRYQVNAIQGDEIWLLLPQAELLLTALTTQQTLIIKDLPLLPTGDLLWSGEAKLGAPFNFIDLAASMFSPTATTFPLITPPIDRHPVQLAEPVWLTDYTVESGELKWASGVTLRIATERLDPLLRFDEKTLHASTAMLGLLRFEAAAWSVQPLVMLTTVKKKAKLNFVGEAGMAVFKKPPKTETIAILHERASRLLRKS